MPQQKISQHVISSALAYTLLAASEGTHLRGNFWAQFISPLCSQHYSHITVLVPALSAASA
jgi:hypothetical protein